MSIIEISHFSKSYGKHLAVDDLSLSINAGEIVGFVGKNGAGKTTTLRAITNMHFPTKGAITINGLDAARDAKEIREIMGYMPGDTVFPDNLTCKDIFNLTCAFSKTDRKKAKELAEYFELDIHRKVAQLSLGNRKKVSIIHMLVKNPKVMIMDEPTSGLDPLMQEKFFTKLLHAKEKGATIFLSSHNLSDIEKHCDRVAVIKGGKLIDCVDLKDTTFGKRQIVAYTTCDGQEKKYNFGGNVNELVEELSHLELAKLEIKISSVEDDFMKYYNEGGNNNEQI